MVDGYPCHIFRYLNPREHAGTTAELSIWKTLVVEEDQGPCNSRAKGGALKRLMQQKSLCEGGMEQAVPQCGNSQLRSAQLRYSVDSGEVFAMGWLYSAVRLETV